MAGKKTTQNWEVVKIIFVRFMIMFFFNFWPSFGGHLFDHDLWSIFQSSLHIYYMLVSLKNVVQFLYTVWYRLYLDCKVSLPYTTNWAILAWMVYDNVTFCKMLCCKQALKLLLHSTTLLHKFNNIQMNALIICNKKIII